MIYWHFIKNYSRMSRPEVSLVQRYHKQQTPVRKSAHFTDGSVVFLPFVRKFGCFTDGEQKHPTEIPQDVQKSFICKIV
jgi:hypothetical protein